MDNRFDTQDLACLDASAMTTSGRQSPTDMQRRLEAIDILRIAAGFAVVVIHASAPHVSDVRHFGSSDWWIANFANSSSRWAVPVFVLISGLLVMPKADDSAWGAFYRRRAARIVVPTIAWTIGFMVWDAAKSHDLDLAQMAERLVMGRPYYHLWFLYMLSGLYLVAPLLAAAIRQITYRQRTACLWFGFALVATDALVRAYHPVQANALLMWVRYTPYFLAGAILGPRVLACRPHQSWWWLLPASGVALTAGLTGVLVYLRGPQGFAFTYDYQGPLVIITALSVFALALSWRSQCGPCGRWPRRLASVMLGVYVVHPIALAVIRKLGHQWSESAAVEVGLYAPAAFALSVMVCLSLSRCPGLRRLVL